MPSPDSVQESALTSPRSKITPERAQELYTAVLDLLRESGYESLTMEGVASRTRCGKSTLYRQWGSKPELVVAALHGTRRMLLSHIDTGTLAGDLREAARAIGEGSGRDTPLMHALSHAGLIVRAQVPGPGGRPARLLRGPGHRKLVAAHRWSRSRPCSPRPRSSTHWTSWPAPRSPPPSWTGSPRYVNGSPPVSPPSRGSRPPASTWWPCASSRSAPRPRSSAPCAPRRASRSSRRRTGPPTNGGPWPSSASAPSPRTSWPARSSSPGARSSWSTSAAPTHAGRPRRRPRPTAYARRPRLPGRCAWPGRTPRRRARRVRRARRPRPPGCGCMARSIRPRCTPWRRPGSRRTCRASRA
ncbi:hypothetical protein SMICM304S_10773 [Streptomyces microflavus]